jgi:hypothetical protein
MAPRGIAILRPDRRPLRHRQAVPRPDHRLPPKETRIARDAIRLTTHGLSRTCRGPRLTAGILRSTTEALCFARDALGFGRRRIAYPRGWHARALSWSTDSMARDAARRMHEGNTVSIVAALRAPWCHRHSPVVTFSREPIVATRCRLAPVAAAFRSSRRPEIGSRGSRWPKVARTVTIATGTPPISVRHIKVHV